MKNNNPVAPSDEDGSMFQELRVQPWRWAARVQTLALDPTSIALEIYITLYASFSPSVKWK